MNKQTLCAVIPAYNEARTISDIVHRTIQQGLPVLVVDDGSRDVTLGLAREAGARVIAHDQNQGKGKAIQTAITSLLEQNWEGALFLDADGQHLPEEIPRFLQAWKQFRPDIVVGSRMKDISSMPVIRKVANKASSLVVSTLAGARVTDSQSGFRLLSRRALESIQAETGTGFELESQMLVMARRAGLTYVEVPISCVYGTEKSHYRSIRDSYIFIRSMLRESWIRIKREPWFQDKD